MQFAYTIAKKLSSFPLIKQIVKDTYAFVGNCLSDRKSDIQGLRMVSSASRPHNFGYYDKCPWSADQRYMIYLSPADAVSNYVTAEAVEIILYDFLTGQETVIAETHVWNSQQGCMLQWLGPDFQTRILFNDFRNGKYCSVIYSLVDKTETVLDMPVYSVSADGKLAVTLDFSRLNTYGPGYGYCNLPDETAGVAAPESPCMWTLDLVHNTVKPLPITYRFLSQWNPCPGMDTGMHKINHIMLNPSANRFMFIHRWIVNGVKHHRLLTCNTDGSDLYVLLDDGMVSHNNWKDDTTLISYCYSHTYGDAYHILHDKTQVRETIAQRVLTVDGHPSFSPDGNYILTDTYPDFKRKQTVYLIRVADGRVKRLGSIYAHIAYRNDVRCDLHPRWSRDGRLVCIDGAKEKQRQVYCFPVDFSF